MSMNYSLVIPTEGPQSGLERRNLFKQIPRLRFAEFTLSEAEWARNNKDCKEHAEEKILCY